MTDTQMAPADRAGLMQRFSERYFVDPAKMNNALKATAFKQRGSDQVTDEQMLALLVVADQYKLNPFTKEIYAFPDKGGIVPIVGVDGWSRIINSDKQFDGMSFEYSEELTQIDNDHKPAPAWCKCIIYRKDRSRAIEVTEYLSEVYRGKMSGYAGPWQSHTARMLRHKAMIQCARIAFGFVGIYDQDEAERIVEGNVVVEGEYTAEPVRERPGRPNYTDAQLEENMDEWKQLVADNKTTPERILGMVESKFLISEEQRQKILGITIPAPSMDDPISAEEFGEDQ